MSIALHGKLGTVEFIVAGPLCRLVVAMQHSDVS